MEPPRIGEKITVTIKMARQPDLVLVDEELTAELAQQLADIFSQAAKAGWVNESEKGSV